MLYLNHAGTSWPKPDVVLQASRAVEEAGPAHWGELFDDAHRRVAALLGVEPSSWWPTPSCTTALSVAVADLPWTPGDRVLTSSMEHHALWRPLASLRGVEVVEIPRGRDGPLDLDALREALGAGGVRLVAMSMAANVTGERLPWEDVVALAHEHGALCLLDGAQVAGWMPLDLTGLEVDLFAFAGHKGPQAPTGVGGLYVRPGLELAGPGGGPTGYCVTGYCDTGSVARPALAGLAAGWEAMDAARPLPAALERARALRAWLQARTGVTVHGGEPGVSTVSFTRPGRRAGEVAAVLKDRGVVVNGSTHCAPRAHRALGTGDAGTVRVSFGPWSSDGDVAHVVEILDATL